MMNQDFERARAFPCNPFEQQLAARARREPFESPLLAAWMIANGDFSNCDCCCDPGPDRFPDDDTPSP